MLFTPLEIPGAFLVDIEPKTDDRGFFARSYCKKEFEAHGLGTRLSQCNISYSEAVGTLRGMHIQLAPYQEAKLVRCTRGSLYDVMVDLRRDSPTYCKWFGVTLTAASRQAVYVPEGCAHGFQTLEPASEAFYQVSEYYSKEFERGYRWNDPAFGIVWPLPDPVLSPRDRAHADYIR